MVQVSLSTSTTFDGDLNALVEDQGNSLTVRFDLDEAAPAGGLKVYIDSDIEQILNRLDLPGAISNPQFENLNLLATQTNLDNSGLAVSITEGSTFATITLDIFDNPEPDTFLPETFDGLVEAVFSLVTADQIAPEDQPAITGVSDYTIAPDGASSTVLFADDVSQLPGAPTPPAPTNDYDEAVDGDISGNPSAPLDLALSEGTTRLSATTGGGDQEYVTVTVPDGFQLEYLTLESYSAGGDVAFIGVQEGSTFTEPLDNSADTSNLLGYALFGGSQAGTDILDNIGNGAGAIGFDDPLSAGTYTFALQQLGAASDYTLAFNVAEATAPPPTPPTPPTPPSGPPVVSFEAVPATISEEGTVEERLLRLEFTVAGEIPEGGLVVLFENLFGITDQADSEAEGAAFEGLGLAPPFDQVNNIIGIRLLENQAAIQLPMINDLIEETTSFDFRLLEGDGYVLDPDQNSTLFTITDDNGGPGVGPTIGLSVSETSLAEGDTFTVNFTVNGTIPAGGVDVLVQSDESVAGPLGQFELSNLDALQLSGVTNLRPGDEGGQSFIATITEANASITLAVFDDIIAEEPIEIPFTLANGELYEVDPGAESVTLTVSDEPQPVGPTVGISLDKTDVVEGETITLSFSVEGEIPADGVTVLVNDNDGVRSLTEFDISGVELSDGIDAFPVPAEGDSGFFVTLTQATASITLPVLDDGADEDEAAESFTFEVIDGEAYEVNADASSVTLNIADPAPVEPTVSFSTDITTLTESEGSVVTFSFDVDGTIPEGGLPVSLQIDAAQLEWFFDFDNNSRPRTNADTGSFDSVLILGDNATGIGGGRLVGTLLPPDFNTLELVITESTASFQFEIFDDVFAEANEDITFTLLDGDGYGVAADNTPIILTLQDGPDGTIDGTSPVVGFSVDKTTIAEGEALTVTFTVTGDIPAGGLPVFVDSDSSGVLGEFNPDAVTFTGLAASPGPDTDAGGFVAIISESTATITLPVFKDGLGEGTEAYTFNIVDGESYDLDPAASEVTLTIEETPPVISVE
ncbi:MAG: hypothetical protein F6K31_27965, partial [Symploca sp. SIO2G7]|nr:hypothetical protein [Symploca sp. SIO2G7]